MRVINGYAYSDDEDRREFQLEIVSIMQALFHISEEEAQGRFDRFAGESTKLVNGEMLFYETADYWAQFIYYGRTKDFLDGDKELTPEPYP